MIKYGNKRTSAKINRWYKAQKLKEDRKDDYRKLNVHPTIEVDTIDELAQVLKEEANFDLTQILKERENNNE